MVSHSCDSLICCLLDKKNQPAEQGIGGNTRAECYWDKGKVRLNYLHCDY